MNEKNKYEGWIDKLFLRVENRGGKNITFDYDEAGYIGKLAPFITIVAAKEALVLSLPFGLRLL
jgi:hypothetical protein